MKTGVTIYRDLNGVKIRQDSKTMFFNANDLLDLYNKQTGEQKRLQDYLDNAKTKELMSALLSDLHNHAKERDLENGIVQTRRGKNGGTWMEPLLMMDFGMWLSVDFKITVLRWFYDNLIKFRNDCGDSFKEVNEALFERKPNAPHWSYSNEATMINKLVFGSVDSGQRNLASEPQLNLIQQLQKADIKLIKQGLDYYERFEELKKLKNLLA